jgi:hypothetical protein
MALTPAQSLTLKTDINTNPTLSGIPNTSDGNFTIAAHYNTEVSPEFYIWKNFVGTMELKKGVIWTEYIGRSAGERDAFRFMTDTGGINPSDANIRTGIQEIFNGPQGSGTRAGLTAVCSKKSNNVEKLFSTGTGTQNSPAITTFFGTVTSSDVQNARNL